MFPGLGQRPCGSVAAAYTITTRAASPQEASGHFAVWSRWGCALAVLAVLEPAAATPPAPRSLTLTSCSVGGFYARCGTFVVYEDRAAAAGRTLALPLVVLPARHPNGRAVFYNPGGPGASAVEVAPLIAAGVVA